MLPVYFELLRIPACHVHVATFLFSFSHLQGVYIFTFLLDHVCLIDKYSQRFSWECLEFTSACYDPVILLTTHGSDQSSSLWD